MAEDIRSILPSTCDVRIPEVDAKPQAFLDRWSETGLSLPYATVTPTRILDIAEIISFAASNGLKVVPAVGTHASFIPINEKTVYVSLSSPVFKNIELNEEKGQVEIGGGVLTGELVKSLADKGWYTSTVNSDAVGVVGALLGGSSGSLNGRHGLGIDQVKAIDIIPFSNPNLSAESGNILTLTPDSEGEEKSLFNILCGAGHGLGIVTSVTLSAFRIKDMQLTDDKIWIRRLVFSPPGVETAAQLFKNLLPPPPSLAPVLIFARAPPTAPVPGAPIIILALSYFGPATKARKVAAESYKEEYTSKAVTIVEASSNWKNINAASTALNAHGGYKESYSTFCSTTHTSSIAKAFNIWNVFSTQDENERSYMILSSWSIDNILDKARERDEKFFPARDRGVFAQFTAWYSSPEGKEDADGAGRKVMDTVREKDREEGKRDFAFANNLVVGRDIGEVYTEEQLREIARVRKVWDESRLGWSPSVDGW